jgi:hypothetical protein
MAISTCTYLGIAGASVLLAQPHTFSQSRLIYGTTRRMGDGTLRRDYSGSGHRWQLGWQWLSTADRGTIQTEAERTASMLFSPPTTATCWDVLVMSYNEEAFPTADNWRWNLTMTVETVTD